MNRNVRLIFLLLRALCIFVFISGCNNESKNEATEDDSTLAEQVDSTGESEGKSDSEPDDDLHPFFLKERNMSDIYKGLLQKFETIKFVFHHNNYHFDIHFLWLGTEESEGKTVDKVEYEVVFNGPSDSMNIMENDQANM